MKIINLMIVFFGIQIACSHAPVPVVVDSPKGSAPDLSMSLLNLDHLFWLTSNLVPEHLLTPDQKKTIQQDAEGPWLTIEGERYTVVSDVKHKIPHPMSIIAVYADYDPKTGKYKKVHAKGAGNQGSEVEGISALDDVARAAVVLLREYEQKGARHLLPLIRRYLEFVLWMQDRDGYFNNFILSDYTKNETGITSKKDFGWWAARALWAMGAGYRILGKDDPVLAGRLKAGIEKTFPLFEAGLKNYGKYATRIGSQGRSLQIPLWLVNGGSDITSVFVLGLIDYSIVGQSKNLKNNLKNKQTGRASEIAQKLCEGLMKYQYGSFSEAPYSAHLSWVNEPTLWHGWGSSQVYALALAGEAFNRSDFMDSAKLDAENWISHLVVSGVPYQVSLPAGSRMFEQIAYAQSVMVTGLDELARVTGDARYSLYAGLLGTWFFGNNMPGTQVFDIQTGRGHDGIDLKISGHFEMNPSSGGESTIESLLAVQALENNPEAKKVLEYTVFHLPVVTDLRGNRRTLAAREIIYPMENSISLEERLYEHPRTGKKIRIIRDFVRKTTTVETR